MNGWRSLVASQPSIWHSLSPTYGSVHTSLKLSLYEYLAKWTLAILAGFSCTNLLLHLLHLHLASLIVGLVEPKLGLGASQLVLCFLKLVLQLRVLHGTVDPQGSEPVHLRGRLPLVSKISRPLQLNVHPENSMLFTCFLSWKSSSQKMCPSKLKFFLLQPRSGSSIEIGPFPFMASTWDFSHERLITEPEN